MEIFVTKQDNRKESVSAKFEIKWMHGDADGESITHLYLKHYRLNKNSISLEETSIDDLKSLLILKKALDGFHGTNAEFLENIKSLDITEDFVDVYLEHDSYNDHQSPAKIETIILIYTNLDGIEWKSNPITKIPIIRDMKKECYSCINKHSVPGNCHIMCSDPDSFMTGDGHGIKNGWFIYPVLFDPVWKTKLCSNYKE